MDTSEPGAGEMVGLLVGVVVVVVLIACIFIAEVFAFRWGERYVVDWHDDVGCRLAALERQTPAPEHCETLEPSAKP